MNEIKDKFGASTALTITLASLADGAGRQSTLVDNSSTRYGELIIYLKIQQSTTAPTGHSIVEIYLLRSDNDGTQHVSDGAGASDAALTPLNAQLIGAMRNKASPGTTDVLYGEFAVRRPGPEWGIAVVNRTGQAFHATGSNHWARYVGVNPEVN